MTRNNSEPFVLILATIAFFGWVSFRVLLTVRFNQDIGGRIKRAANASSIELAEGEISSARTNMASICDSGGYTSVLYRTPDEDVDFWCHNLEAAHSNLIVTTHAVDGLAESNILMKLRETLLDKHDKLTAPAGIAVHPHNTGFAIWGWLSIIITSVAGVANVQRRT